jgi:excisionase family DNA binding protein
MRAENSRHHTATKTWRDRAGDLSSGTQTVPLLLTVDDAAEFLRTTRRAIYAMIERHQLPGIVRIGRRVLLRADELVHWLNQKSASSLRSEQR